MRRAVAGHPFTKSGIEIAIWDILGKAAGLPIYRLLGGAVRRQYPDQDVRFGSGSRTSSRIGYLGDEKRA